MDMGVEQAGVRNMYIQHRSLKMPPNIIGECRSIVLPTLSSIETVVPHAPPSVCSLMSSVGKGCGSFWDTFCSGCSTVGFMGLGASAILLCTAAFGNVGADRASRLYLAGGLSMAGGVLCCMSTGLVHACRDNPDRLAIVSFLTCLLHGGTYAPPIADAPNDDALPPRR